MKKNNFPLITAICCFGLLGSAAINAEKIIFNKDFYYPGDTLSVKIIQSSETARPLRCFWRDQEYPFLSTGEGITRTLLPIPANTQPGNHELQIFYPQTAEKKYRIEIKAKKFPEERIIFSREKNDLFNLPENVKQRELILSTLRKLSEKQEWQGKFIMPVSGKFSSIYGVHRSTETFHKGVDISTAIYTRVSAPNQGVVLLAAQLNLQGNTAILDHGQGVCTVYYHLSSLAVRSGQILEKGDKIGEVGDTGLATGAHLHWGLYIHGEAVDPLVWLNEEF